MIEFVQLESSHVSGQVDLRLPLAIAARVDMPAPGDGFVDMSLALVHSAQGETYTEAAPPLPASSNGSILLTFDAAGFVHTDAAVDFGFDVDMFAGPSGITDLGFRVWPEARGANPWAAYGLLEMQGPQIMGIATLPDDSDRAAESFVLGSRVTADVVYVLTERMALGDRFTPMAKLLASVLERLTMNSQQRPLFLAVIEDDLDVTDEIAAEAALVGRIVDRLMLADNTLGFLDALGIVVTAMVLQERLTPVLQGETEDGLVLSAELAERINALVEVAAGLVLAAETSFNVVVFAAVKDSLTVADDRTALLALLAEVFDSMNFAVRLRMGDELFIGYAVNIRNTAVTEYDNFPFNAMAFIGGRPYGTSDEGLFRLEGADDDDDPIHAMVRTGLTEFPELVRAVNAWVVMTADGEILFKTITGDEGAYETAIYRMHARPQGTSVETRFDLDKGYVGTAWAFELENVDGAYFELDSARFWPVTVGRRYSGR